jgi:hypothetical protein
MQTNASVDVFLSGESSGAETRKKCQYPYTANPDPDNGPEHGTSHDGCIMQCPAPIFSSHDLRQQWFAYVAPGVIAFVPSVLLVFEGERKNKKKQVRSPFFVSFRFRGDKLG